MLGRATWFRRKRKNFAVFVTFYSKIFEISRLWTRHAGWRGKRLPMRNATMGGSRYSLFHPWVPLLRYKEIEDENDDEDENDWGSGGRELRLRVSSV